MVLDELIVDKDTSIGSIDTNADDEISPIEVARTSRALAKYAGKLASLKMIWIKDGARYTWEESTKWFDDLALASAAPSDSQLIRSSRFDSGFSRPAMAIPKEVKNKPVEELAEELLEFIRKEFPDGNTRTTFVAQDLFWQRKGVNQVWADPEARLLIQKVSDIANKRLGEEREKQEKERLPDLIEQVVEWAKEYDLPKLTKANLKACLGEKGESISRTSEDILLQHVNFRLKDLRG